MIPWWVGYNLILTINIIQYCSLNVNIVKLAKRMQLSATGTSGSICEPVDDHAIFDFYALGLILVFNYFAVNYFAE